MNGKTELPLYRAMYTLVIYLYTVVRQFRKEFKYTLGQSILDTGWNTLDLIVTANTVPNEQKGEILRSASASFDKLKTRLRAAHELKLISSKRFAYLMSENEGIGQMLGGWLAWAEGKRSAQARP